jgi:hypothetical protein
MFRMTAQRGGRRGLAALGIAMGLAMTAGIPASSAQTGPRALPNLQNQPQDQYQYDRRDDRLPGAQYDRRDDRDARTPSQQLDRRLSFLHEQLRITPRQERLWIALADVLREEMQDRGERRYLNDRIRAPNVLERLEQRERRLADATQRMDHILSALRPLYASFSEEQKRTADRLMFQADGRRAGDGFGRDRGFDRGPGGPGADRDRDRDGRFFDRPAPPPRFDDRQDRDYR